MSVYDTDVKKLLGKEAYNYILDRVQCGVISARHMRDISDQLHPHIRGNHQRRVESGALSDGAEFRHILGDWFSQGGLCDMDQQAALTRLVSILRGPPVSLPAEGKRLEEILEEKPEISVAEVIAIKKDMSVEEMVAMKNEVRSSPRRTLTLATCFRMIALLPGACAGNLGDQGQADHE